RDKLEALELVANGPSVRVDEEAEASPAAEQPKPPVKAKAAKAAADEIVVASAPDDGFTDTLKRWAKLPPALDAAAISGYLYLAASFAKIEVIDTGLPERLRDMAD